MKVSSGLKRKCGDDQNYDGVETENEKRVRVEETVFSMGKILENVEIEIVIQQSLEMDSSSISAGGGKWSSSGGGSWCSSDGGPWSSSLSGKLSSAGGTRPGEDVNIGASICVCFCR